MRIGTWFGIFTIDNGSISNVDLFQKEPEAILERLLKEPLLLTGKIAGKDLGDLAIKYGFAGSKEEYLAKLHEINILLVREKMKQALTMDRRIISAVEAIDDMDETCNFLAERLKEWYMIYFGEIDLKGGDLANHIIAISLTSHESEGRIIQDLARSLLGLYETRRSIEAYLKESMEELAPNLTDIAGHTLGARLLSLAGSLDKLASMPSSTVQVIGASNALFKHLRGKAPSPKHGVIFRHPYVNTAPGWQRGKIARALASKISLAARFDHYSGELKGSLRPELEKKIRDIRKRNRSTVDQ